MKLKIFIIILVSLLLLSCGGGDSTADVLNDIENDAYNPPLPTPENTDTTTVENQENKQSSSIKVEADKIRLQIVEEFGLPENIILPYYAQNLTEASVQNNLEHRVHISPGTFELQIFDPSLPGTTTSQLSQTVQWSRTMDGEFTYITGTFSDNLYPEEATIVVCLTKTEKLYYIKYRNRYLFASKPSFKTNEKTIIYYHKETSKAGDKTKLDGRYYEVRPGDYLNSIIDKYNAACPKESLTLSDVVRAPENAKLVKSMGRRNGRYTVWPGDIIYLPTASCEALGH